MNSTRQDIHFYEPYRVNNLLALLKFAEGMENSLEPIPYAPSSSVIDLRFYLEPKVFAQMMSESGGYASGNISIIAAILALRQGAKLPLVGSRFVQLRDAENGNYVVVELNPVIARIVHTHTAGYTSEPTAGQAD